MDGINGKKADLHKGSDIPKKEIHQENWLAVLRKLFKLN